jgi:hypothetical protein
MAVNAQTLLSPFVTGNRDKGILKASFYDLQGKFAWAFWRSPVAAATSPFMLASHQR